MSQENSGVFPVTGKNRISRLPKRGDYSVETIHNILDEALFVTLAYADEGQPMQIPTGHCRIGEYIYIHGSVGSGYLRKILERRLPVSISATLMDGIVLARSAFHHSVNYRSVIVFSSPELVTDEAELYNCLEVFTNKMQPGRWADVRKPDSNEWKATMVVKFRLEEASAKIRTGGPKDDEEDYELPVWAGVVPLRIERKSPEADPLARSVISLPDYLK